MGGYKGLINSINNNVLHLPKKCKNFPQNLDFSPKTIYNREEKKAARKKLLLRVIK